MPKDRLINKFLALIISAAAVLSSCSSNTPAATTNTTAFSSDAQSVFSDSEDNGISEASYTEQPETSASSEETTEYSETEALTETQTPEQDDGSASVSDVTDQSDDTSDTSVSEETVEPAAETEVETSPVTASETEPATEAETVSVTSETTQVSATEQGTTTSAPPETTVSSAAAATEKPVPSPPVISEVSSDGVSVFECKKGVIDYSNASKGYISAIYLGKKKVAKLRMTCSGNNYDYTIYPDGKYHYFTLSAGSGDYTAKMFEQADGNYYSDVIGGSFTAKIADEVKQFTYTNDYVYFNADSACVAKASELCGGCSSDIEKISAIFTYVADTISYDYELAATVKSFYIPDPDTTLKKKTGVCFDYSSLMAAMLRSQGIPTRLLVGYASELYHAWNEVYTVETGWITLEILLQNKGFNLLDSTFYSTSKDKKYIAEYMSNRANYTKIYTY